MYVCIGQTKRLIFKSLDIQGCGLTWDYDTPDGKCPVCRGNLVPESFLNKSTK